MNLLDDQVMLEVLKRVFARIGSGESDEGYFEQIRDDIFVRHDVGLQDLEYSVVWFLERENTQGFSDEDISRLVSLRAALDRELTDGFAAGARG